MPENVPNFAKGDRFSKGVFAAVLKANQENCTCGACTILKSITNDLTQEFTV